jgi:hypothetical protein
MTTQNTTAKKEEEIAYGCRKSVVYKTDVGNIQVAMCYSQHKKNWYVQGSIYGKLETGGGSSNASAIKGCIKKFIQDNDLKMNGKISHSIYGIYAVELSY